MGTFIGHYGCSDIPEKKREEFKERVLKIMDQGGIMYRDDIHIYGKELNLLIPYRATDSGYLMVDFNYFEDDSWETADFLPEDAVLRTGKVGSNEFNAVMTAIYILSEFYSKEPCITEENGELFDAPSHISWLNYLFDERYTNERFRDLWKIYNLLPEEEKGSDLFDMVNPEDMDRLYPSSAIKYMVLSGKVTLDDLLEEISLGETSQSLESIGIIDWIQLLLKSLRKIYESHQETLQESLEYIIQLLKSKESLQEFWDQRDKEEWPVIFSGAFLPKEVVVKCIAFVFGIDYERAMKEWGHLIFDRSQILDGFSEPLDPLPPMDTITFLNDVHNYFVKLFAHSDKDLYDLTDDDRIWWWREGGDVHFSDKLRDWMQALREEWQEILEQETELHAIDIQKLWVYTLADANQTYRNMFCFHDCFYEFLAQTTKPEIQAAILLLKRLVDRNRQEMPQSANYGYIEQLQRMDAPARREIKRYLALLGNIELRSAVFGF